MVLRQRKKVEGIERVVQELDAFPKVPEDYVEQTASGASGKPSIPRLRFSRLFHKSRGIFQGDR